MYPQPKKTPPPTRRGPAERGTSLLSVVVAIGMLGIAVVGGNQVGERYVAYVAQLTAKGEEDDLRRYIHAHISCEKTVATQLDRCDGSDEPLYLYRDDCSKLGDERTDYTEIFGYKLRAKCDSLITGGTSPYGLQIEASRIRPGRPDRWGNLFAEVPIACTSLAAGVNTKTFAIRYEIDNFLREEKASGRHPEFPDLPTSGHTFNDLATATKVCELAGCSTVIERVKRKYDSPSNNHIFYWSAAADNFIVVQANSQIDGKKANNYMNYLSCGECDAGGATPCL